jgi:hypothetical protein
MSWSDASALKTFKDLRDYFGISLFIETGTFHGVNAAVQAANFRKVITIEINEEYYNSAVEKLKPYPNVEVKHLDSALMLEGLQDIIYSEPCVLIYLDAHFYDASLPEKDRWVILRELRALKNTDNVILVIHDFDNGLGHLTYDGQSMNLKFLSELLFKINPNFHYYTNRKETCDIITKERVAAGEIPNLVLDEVTADNLDYAWSHETKTYRGILYCTPEELDLSKFNLIPWS